MKPSVRLNYAIDAQRDPFALIDFGAHGVEHWTFGLDDAMALRDDLDGAITEYQRWLARLEER